MPAGCQLFGQPVLYFIFFDENGVTIDKSYGVTNGKTFGD
jgi:hypothetical protein